MNEISFPPLTCDDCQEKGRLEQHGRVWVCPTCLVGRRRAEAIEDGAARRPLPDLPRHLREQPKLEGRWLSYPDFRPYSDEMWEAIRHRPHRLSADGNWREWLDENGNVLATAVRLELVARASHRRGVVP